MSLDLASTGTEVERKPRSPAVQGVIIVLGLLAIMWVIQLVNAVDSYHLNSHGIRPRAVSGLQGVAFAPFLHASFAHLLGNTVPFLVLGAVVALEGPLVLAEVTGIVALVAGLGTWLIAPGGSVTVGASGIIFGYAAFLITRGLFNRRAVELAIGAVVAVLFGGALAYDLIPHPGVSWQDHFFGAVGGIIAARVIATAKQSAPVDSSVAPTI